MIRFKGKRLHEWRRRVEADATFHVDCRYSLGTPEEMADDRPVWVPSLDSGGKPVISIRCINCGAIQDVAGHPIDSYGNIERDCIHCPRCKNMFYAKLDNWSGRQALFKYLKRTSVRNDRHFLRKEAQ